MQGGGIAKQRSIGKKKGGFLFANAAEKTPEDLRREEEERNRKIQEEYERSLAPPLAPSSIPLATLGDDEKDNNMATATSLRERLKQYQSLKAEQQASAADVNAVPIRGTQQEPEESLNPPINRPEETKAEPPKDSTPPGKTTLRLLLGKAGS